MATGGEVDGSGVNTSDGVQEFTCGTCNQGNRVTEASYYCPDCDQCYCKACLCDHSVVGKADQHRWGKTSSKKEDLQSEEVMCLRHPKHEYSLYCVDDDVLCCDICVAAEHRTCKKVQAIKVAADQVDLDEDERKVKSDIDNIKRHLSFISYESNFKEKNAVQSHSKYIEQVRGIRRVINGIMDDIEANANTCLIHLQNKFEIDRRFCEKLTEDIQEIESNFELSVTDKTRHFTQVKGRRDVIVGLLKSVSDIQTANMREVFLLKTQQSVRNILSAIKDMGKLVMGVSRKTFECNIGPVCQIDNGDLFLVDAANKAVLQVDDTLNIARTLQFEQTPTDVCSAGANSIAVLLDEKTVQFISVGSSEEPTTIIRLKENPQHLIVFDDKLYMAYKQGRRSRNLLPSRNSIRVKCFTKQGDQLSCIEVDCVNFVEGLESLPLVAYAQKLFLLSRSGTLFTYDTEGNTLESVQLVKDITGLAVDDLGSVYAGGYEDNIYKKTLNGILDKFSVNNLGISSPQVLCWDKRRGRLVVRCEEGHTLYWI